MSCAQCLVESEVSSTYRLQVQKPATSAGRPSSHASQRETGWPTIVEPSSKFSEWRLSALIWDKRAVPCHSNQLGQQREEHLISLVHAVGKGTLWVGWLDERSL